MTPRDEKKSDTASWVDEHGDALYRYALLRVKDPTVAEDLVQETFLSALKGIDGFKGGSSLRTWMVGILKHKIIDYFRKGKPEILASDLAAAYDETEAEKLDRSHSHRERPTPWQGDPDKLLENKEFWGVLMECLDALPQAHRRAFSMREIDGIKGEEICKILNITSTNLWVILHRARVKLRNCLDANWFKSSNLHSGN
jgi:RNA polymerase sigma-70 factor (TIGR02943 family)